MTDTIIPSLVVFIAIIFLFCSIYASLALFLDIMSGGGDFLSKFTKTMIVSVAIIIAIFILNFLEYIGYL